MILLFAVLVGALVALNLKPSESDLLSGPAPRPAPPGMVWIPGGTFLMGSDDRSADWRGLPLFDDTWTIHAVSITGFFMDVNEVTNDEFAKFVTATGYVTLAEKPVDEARLRETLPPGQTPTAAMLAPGSLVFVQPPGPVDLLDLKNWWKLIAGADWRHPEGPDSDLKGRGNHPVVHVAYDDALAYCKWAGKRLPTEAEWEYAARGGLSQKQYTWGDDEPEANGIPRCNRWQGEFPWQNTRADGHIISAPVGSYPPNGYGLHDMAGNVWEWCHDWYRPDYYGKSPRLNPQGPDDSFDPQDNNAKRVQRGGSFLCNETYCSRYKSHGRGKGTPFEATSHAGFRCVVDAVK
jgi:formylglycine-generating enzyme required for sulfatase activity